MGHQILTERLLAFGWHKEDSARGDLMREVVDALARADSEIADLHERIRALEAQPSNDFLIACLLGDRAALKARLASIEPALKAWETAQGTEKPARPPEVKSD